jgi:hemerythrin-like domain-containing protein
MCEYCGCQEIPAIAELTREHDRLRDLGRDLVNAAARGDADAARRSARAMQAVLAVHTRVEEQALFPAMAWEFAGHMNELITEHRAADAVLESLASGSGGAQWPAQARGVVEMLFEHILKEQDGVFPAALSVLTPEEWDVLTVVRQATVPTESTARSETAP